MSGTTGQRGGSPPVLAGRKVSKSFSGIVALSEVSVAVDHGERVGLIGPNGAGKTTLFNCLLGIEKLSSGVVEIDGRDVSGLRVHERARLGVGRTFQRIELFAEATVREHLLIAERTRRRSGWLGRDLLGMGRPKADEIAACDAVLDLLGLGELADEPSEHLSLGQGRLLEVGRALMTSPRLLLLDEPSSGLDTSETRDLARTLLDVQAEHGFAVLLVEHDVDFVAEFTDRCYAIDTGQLLIEGPTGSVLDSPEVKEAYLGISVEAS